ncbi:MAG: superoxide dismutase [Planctomycetota bacterium]|nr:superoxide dismutase [Planctomycetota bacterium]
MAFQLPELSYPLSALEPHIDAQTMGIHHGKHHAAYVSKLNAALSDHPQLQNASIEELCSNIAELPESIRGAVRNNGGGHFNHSFFWTSLSADGGGSPSGNLAAAIDSKFGHFEGFCEAFTTAAQTRFGSGWAWLCRSADGSVNVCSSANQDNPWMAGVVDCVGTPLLGLDVWEHAYYLKYQNRRPEYVDAFWNVVDWAAVEARFEEASS